MYGHMRVVLSCRFRKKFYFKREWAGPGGGYYYVEPYFDNKLYCQVSNPSQLRKCRILSMILNDRTESSETSIHLFTSTHARHNPSRFVGNRPNAGFR